MYGTFQDIFFEMCMCALKEISSVVYKNNAMESTLCAFMGFFCSSFFVCSFGVYLERTIFLIHLIFIVVVVVAITDISKMVFISSSKVMNAINILTVILCYFTLFVKRRHDENLSQNNNIITQKNTHSCKQASKRHKLFRI